MLILAIILFGMLVGAAAQLLLGNSRPQHQLDASPSSPDWSAPSSAVCSASLLSGDGLDLRPSGIIGSIVGAILRDPRLGLLAGPPAHGHLTLRQSSGRSGASTNSVNRR